MAFTIKELEALSGIKAHTIRIWEQRYRFLKPLRTDTNIRTYSNEELKELLTVSLLNRYGYKISRIDAMQSEERSAAALQLTDRQAQNEHLVNKFISCMIDLKVHEFEALLNKHISQHGLFESITSIVFPFLDKTGVLWQTNRILPVHEHIVTSVIRQKIIAAIDLLPPAPEADQPLYLLFLPENEHHELGLLFVYYLLKNKGIPVLYLGASVPFRDVEYVINRKSPAFLYLHLTSFPRQQSFEKYILNLVSKCKAAQVLITGYLTHSYNKPLPQNVRFFKSLNQLTSYISQL